MPQMSPLQWELLYTLTLSAITLALAKSFYTLSWDSATNEAVSEKDYFYHKLLSSSWQW